MALNFIKNHDICPTYDPYDMDYSNIFSHYHLKNSISFSWRYRTQRQQKPSRQPMPRGGKIPYPRLPFFQVSFYEMNFKGDLPPGSFLLTRDLTLYDYGYSLFEA